MDSVSKSCNKKQTLVASDVDKIFLSTSGKIPNVQISGVDLDTFCSDTPG